MNHPTRCWRCNVLVPNGQTHFCHGGAEANKLEKEAEKWAASVNVSWDTPDYLAFHSYCAGARSRIPLIILLREAREVIGDHLGGFDVLCAKIDAELGEGGK